MSEIARHRRGGQAGRRAERAAAPIVQKKYITREIPLYELLNAEGLELDPRGVDDHPRGDRHRIPLRAGAQAVARGRRRRARAIACTSRAAWCWRSIKTAPREYTQHARNPERNVVIGGRNTVFAPTYGSPFVRDFENKRRYGTLEDLQNFIKLAYMTPELHHSGGVICEPVDVPVPKRHLDIVYSHIKYSDKPFMGIVTAPERAEDTVRLAQILFGERLRRRQDRADLGRQLQLADGVGRHHAGGAHRLCPQQPGGAGDALHHGRRHGPRLHRRRHRAAQCRGAGRHRLSPSSCGRARRWSMACFATTVSMQSGAPMMGTPEPAQMIYVATQLARKLRPARARRRHAERLQDRRRPGRLRIRSPTMIPTLLAGTNFILHSAGWLEAGLAAGYGKFMLDADQIAMLQQLRRRPRPLRREPRHGGDPRGRAGRPLSRLRPHPAQLQDRVLHCRRSPTTTATSSGRPRARKDANQRATEAAQRLLAQYEPPPLDPAIDEALLDFIARRKSELPNAVT